MVRRYLSLAIWLSLAAVGVAQDAWHYMNKADAPPGVIGQRQLQRGGPLPGYFQPVEITAPKGTLVSVVCDGDFSPPQEGKLLAGMLIGQVYRLRIGNIALHEGDEVFPTIEVIDRLYPPPGQAARFPIPIELTAEELQYAIDGRYVLRVIYLEDVRTAPPVREEPGKQRFLEIAPGRDAMEAADRLGRPMAILRMGSRVPLVEEDPSRFAYSGPPVLMFEPPQVVERLSGLEPPLEAPLRMGRPSRNFQRVPTTQFR